MLGDREFRRICQLVRAHAGIVLGDAKRPLVQTRLAPRLRALGLASYTDYVALLDDANSPEHAELVNAITTNVTAFFREPHHFELLGQVLAQRASRTRRLRVWSAGCSSGQEPWSIAMTIRETLGACAGLDIKVLATDIDTDILEAAAAGSYSPEQVAPVGRERLQRFFTRDGAEWRITDELRSLVTFKQLNLFAPWPMHGPFDVIFCRNVIIYFDVENKAKLIRRYHALLAPEGHLLLGHSESIGAGAVGFASVGRTAYRKAA